MLASTKFFMKEGVVDLVRARSVVTVAGARVPGF